MRTATHPAPVAPPNNPSPPPVGPAARRVLRPVVGLVLIMVSLSVATLWATPSTSVERDQTTHPAADRLVLQLGAVGDVEVRVHDADEIVVETERRWGIREVDVSQIVAGEELRLETSRCTAWIVMPWNDCTASFVVTVPAATAVVGSVDSGLIEITGVEGDVDVRTGNGRIDVSDTTGRVDLRTDNGAVHVTSVAGAVTATSSNGAIRLTGVRGPVEASTGNGAIEVDGVEGVLVVSTDNGRIDVQGARADTVELSSGNGHIDFAALTTPRTAQLRTDNGAIEVLLPPDAPPVAVTTNRSDGDVDIAVATDPSATHQLEARTGNGSVRVGYAPG